MVKLKDVAKAAGMSVTQVSRALNDYDDVKEETKVRIKAIAAELGYVKNMTAQKLAMGKSNQIALMIKGLDDKSNLVGYNSIYPILCGINEYIMSRSYEVVVYVLREKVDSYVQYCKEKGIDNAILFGFEFDDPAFKELIKSPLTCVCIDIPIEGENKGSILIDNASYTVQAVEALIQSGKQNIAMLSGSCHAIVSIEREAGYVQALKKHQMNVNAQYIVHADFQESVAKDLTLDILQRHPEIDAFCCASDYMAIGCMEALKSIGKKIPEDVAIIGFDNVPLSKYLTPSLSTVSQDDFKKGYEATKLLVSILDGHVVNKKVMLDCELILRQSV